MHCKSGWMYISLKMIFFYFLQARMRNNEDIVWLLYWIYFVCFAFGINGPTWRGQKQPSANRATCCKKLISASNKRSENLLKLVLIRGSIVQCIVGARLVSLSRSWLFSPSELLCLAIFSDILTLTMWRRHNKN